MNNKNKLQIEYKKIQSEIIKLLLDKNINIKIKNNIVFEYASPSSYLETIEFLLDKDVNISIDINYTFKKAAKNAHLIA